MHRAKILGKRPPGSHLVLDFLDVIEIVGEGGMDVDESDSRNVRHDLVGGHALMLVPHHNIGHTDAVASDAGLSAADAGSPGDPVLECGRNLSINRLGRPRGGWLAQTLRKRLPHPFRLVGLALVRHAFGHGPAVDP